MGRRIALRLEYDGAAYGGSQLQPNARTIQGELEQAIRRLTGETVRAAFAGRTDAGVHATGQVAAFDTESEHGLPVLYRALNALLPEDIAVQALTETPPAFDPRRHALWRRYEYRIWNEPAPRPLKRRTHWHVPAGLDVEAMDGEARSLAGEHDVASFGGDPGPGRSTRRVVLDAGVRRLGGAIIVEMCANAFLPHQVRRTAGALVEVGRGRLPQGTFRRWLEHPRTGLAGPAAPPHGLSLVWVQYGDPPGDLGAWYRPGMRTKQHEDLQHEAD
ncbi:MAG: tRNA pseudouridine(38-40) synthase TruA [Chloroflexi bacterium]|nr:tRNA pseudouridine(38-40) synthase TruA [Chloroflexota bacterium]